MALSGKWEVHASSDSMEPWLKGLGWNFLTAKAGGAAKPSLDITQTGDHISIEATSTFKSGKIEGPLAASEAAQHFEAVEHELMGKGQQAWYRDGDAVVHVFKGEKRHSKDRYYVKDGLLVVEKQMTDSNGAPVVAIKRIYSRH
eukprot:EG_transcript_25128